MTETPKLALLVALLIGMSAPAIAQAKETPKMAIKGTVLWGEDKAPRRRKIRMDSDPTCVQLCQGEDLLDERAIIDEKGRFENVVLYISKGLPERKWPVPEAKVKIDQVKCRYIPHVVAFQLGQTVKIHNSDPTPHNVHFVSRANGSWNVNMTQPGVIDPKTPFQSVEYERPTALLKCDIHPWMEARVFIFDHPFFTKSGPDGTFAIDLSSLPAGDYTLTAVHEKYRGGEIALSLKAGETATVDFRFFKEEAATAERKVPEAER